MLIVIDYDREFIFFYVGGPFLFRQNPFLIHCAFPRTYSLFAERIKNAREELLPSKLFIDSTGYFSFGTDILTNISAGAVAMFSKSVSPITIYYAYIII